MVAARQLRSQGFTLIEMIVVILIVGILASAATPLLELSRRRAQEQELRENLRTLRLAIDAYKQAWDAGHIEHHVEDTGYPPELATLVSGVVDAKAADGSRIYFLRRIPRDPFASAQLSADKTWGLRSYESPPDAPAPGRDVYDVYSQSEQRGLDGQLYKDW